MKLPEQVWLKRGIRAAALASWLTILTTSFVPGAHASIIGHVLAYALSAAATRLAFTRAIRSRWQILGFVAFSGLMEIAQIFVPKHNASIIDWLTSSAGAIVGILLARTFAHQTEPLLKDP